MCMFAGTRKSKVITWPQQFGSIDIICSGKHTVSCTHPQPSQPYVLARDKRLQLQVLATNILISKALTG